MKTPLSIGRSHHPAKPWSLHFPVGFRCLSLNHQTWVPCSQSVRNLFCHNVFWHAELGASSLASQALGHSHWWPSPLLHVNNPFWWSHHWQFYSQLLPSETFWIPVIPCGLPHLTLPNVQHHPPTLPTSQPLTGLSNLSPCLFLVQYSFTQSHALSPHYMSDTVPTLGLQRNTTHEAPVLEQFIWITRRENKYKNIKTFSGDSLCYAHSKTQNGVLTVRFGERVV